MIPKKSITYLTATTAVALATLLASTPSAMAAENTSHESTVVLGPDAPLYSAAADQQIQDALESLIGTQSQAEIETLASQKMTTILYDWETDTDLAAVKVIPNTAPAARVITQLGPGCSRTSLCLQNGRFHGFTGTGMKAVNIPSVFQAFSGDSIASLTPTSGTIKVLAPGVTLQFHKPNTIAQITRG